MRNALLSNAPLGWRRSPRCALGARVPARYTDLPTYGVSRLTDREPVTAA